jgi:hypothetical protein
MKGALTAVMFLVFTGVAQACTPYVEVHADGAASLRPHATGLVPCEIDEAAYRRVVGEWLRTRPAGAPLRSVALGRAVTLPWLSQLLTDTARHDAAWLARVKRLKPGERDRLVAELVMQTAFTSRLALGFDATPYALQGVSYEKVLWKDGLPYDAQLWLRVAAR